MLDVLLDLQVDLLPAFVLLKELSQLLPLANIILLQVPCAVKPTPINHSPDTPILTLIQREGFLGSLARPRSGLEDSSHPGMDFRIRGMVVDDVKPKP